VRQATSFIGYAGMSGIAAASLLTLALASPTALAARQGSVHQWPASEPAHRAIFCGEAGTETSLAYASALNAAITHYTRQGASAALAMQALRARAQCARGSELPVADELLSGSRS
jgi:hypothetical protein